LARVITNDRRFGWVNRDGKVVWKSSNPSPAEPQQGVSREK
jgi:hypothetical protein